MSSGETWGCTKSKQEKGRKGVEFFEKNDSLPPVLLFALKESNAV
jgi:hypothetical protein